MKNDILANWIGVLGVQGLVLFSLPKVTQNVVPIVLIRLANGTPFHQSTYVNQDDNATRVMNACRSVRTRTSWAECIEPWDLQTAMFLGFFLKMTPGFEKGAMQRKCP